MYEISGLLHQRLRLFHVSETAQVELRCVNCMYLSHLFVDTICLAFTGNSYLPA
jgi:hypothetical protein